MTINPIVRACLFCLLLVCVFACAAAVAGQPGEAQKKAAAQAAPAPTAKAPAPAPADPEALAERVVALERENLVLREDLGKARLDARTRSSELEKQQAEDAAAFQEKIDALNAELEAERSKQARRNRNVWIAIGVVAVGLLLTAD
jgi:hypothetical protein